MRSFEEQLAQSRKDFEFIKPMLKNVIAGDFVQVEDVEETIARTLDLKCGVDYLNVKDGLYRTVSSRIQRGKAFDSFTVRREKMTGVKTEYEKRKESIKNEGLYPQFTLQAYLNEDGTELISMAAVRTKDLFEYIDNGHAYNQHTKWSWGIRQAALFYVCEWADMIKRGYDVRIYRGGN